MLTFYHNPQSFHDYGVWSPMETFEYVNFESLPKRNAFAFQNKDLKKQLMTI